MTIKIAIISDLHCHPSAQAMKASFFLSDGPRKPVKLSPVQALSKLIEDEKLECDILVLPGDFTDKADYHGFVVSVLSCREIGRQLKAQAIIACLGNHDVDSRHQFSEDHLYLGKRLFVDFPLPCPHQCEQFYNSGFAVEEGDNWRCLLVNSVLHHRDEIAAKRGILTTEQLDAIDSHLKVLPSKDIQFCVFHHHAIPHEEMDLGAADLMEGGERLLKILENNGYLIAIHGHKHHPRIRYSNGGTIAIPIFAAGSLAAIIGDRLSRSVRNTFHILELETTNPEFPYARGIIHTWEFSSEDGWVPSTMRSAGIAHQTGFGNKSGLSELANRIIAILGDEKWLRWEDVLLQMPDLKFVMPGDIAALSKLLENSGIFLTPNPHEASLIGRNSQ